MKNINLENAQPKQLFLFSTATYILAYKYSLSHCGLFHYIFDIRAITV
jgi:hypothetical protein